MPSLESLTRVKPPPVEAEEGAAEQLLTVNEVAKRLSLHSRTVYTLVHTGQLGHYKLGHRIRISQAQLTTYLNRKDQSPL